MTESPADAGPIEAQISQEIVRIHEDSYGVGVRGIATHLIDDLVLIVMDVELTAAERTLLDGGNSKAIRTQREAYQSVIGPTFSAVVERATGRRVVSFMSHMNMDPIYAVELFRLGPVPRYQTA
jgi:uncharacterized protein YbcI